MSNENNRAIYQLVDTLLAAAGYQPDSSARHNLGMLDFSVGDAEMADLRAQLAAREAEVARLREIVADNERRAGVAAEKAARDKALDIRDLTRLYVGEISAQSRTWRNESSVHAMADIPYILRFARALATAVVEAEG